MPVAALRERTARRRVSSADAIPRDREFVESARRLAAMEIAYIGHPAFSTRGSEQWLEAQRPADSDRPTASTPSVVGIAFVSGLVAAALLSPAEEGYLFLKMNYLRYRAERTRRKIEPRQPSRAVVTEVQELLAESIRLRNIIAEANVRLAVAAAKKLSRSVDQMSDLISEAMPPLLRAVELFDVHRGYRFSTYATWAVRNQMIRVLRRQRGLRESLRSDLDGTWDDVLDQRTTAVTDETAVAPTELIANLMQTLSERERQIVNRRFGLHGQPGGQSLAEIAGQVGLSKERVRQLVLGAVEKMRVAARNGVVALPEGWDRDLV
ncbi:MAG TPA: sigma-70 family RNA polymerase sigma factor [Planctomycetaceae bacterium]|nr:sigma-70 family RNA polymerase sigma factor [Planctomycetaceae bacterium]